MNSEPLHPQETLLTIGLYALQYIWDLLSQCLLNEQKRNDGACWWNDHLRNGRTLHGLAGLWEKMCELRSGHWAWRTPGWARGVRVWKCAYDPRRPDELNTSPSWCNRWLWAIPCGCCQPSLGPWQEPYERINLTWFLCTSCMCINLTRVLHKSKCCFSHVLSYYLYSCVFYLNTSNLSWITRVHHTSELSENRATYS